MSKIITIKLTRSSSKAGPFTITDQFGNIIASDVSKAMLINGISYSVADNVSIVTLESTGICKYKKSVDVAPYISQDDLYETPYTQINTACLWRHLTNTTINNSYYGVVKPYIIEYPFSYQYYNEILQNIKDYTKAFFYIPDPTGVFSYTDKVEIDNVWFNKAIIYNGQQSSGIIELVPKPMHDLKLYLSYPIYNIDSKTIIYTKSDNFYQYNCFWSIVKDKTVPLFLTTCEYLSLDKVVNQSNMDYSQRSFKKEPFRAKQLKVRHILDNRSDVHLVSMFIYGPSQISYK
jgi:hypothetical protein